ncbi:MAG: hypothetical protein P0Y55_16105 [Candidatus Cohnella colombiensis]|uniref:Uncharacterized protein n=1 Tax=Candidatus Cohnella colombiensis TaxID=3121368 RepID=A0AA95EWB2_9BACL|nr:MAG: hypothetical protein P0Y55_16105 [Cohnella sp.]
MRRKKFGLVYIVGIALIVIIATPFVIWRFVSHTQLDIVVFNKTFPLVSGASGEVVKLDYSKQQGLYWLMNYMGLKRPDTNKEYNVKRDYYGNFLDNGKLVNKPLESREHTPDVIFISDMYGTGNSKTNGSEPAGVSGMRKEEVAVIATSYEKGTTIIGEYNIAGDPTTSDVAQELEHIFGLHFTGVAGKFFSDLSSELDVPHWIRAIYERQYGKQWNLSGAGIVIAGNDRIVVLQREVGFVGSSLQIRMSEQEKSYDRVKAVDYYNWFEIVEPVNSQSVIAWYDLKLTEAGAAQLKPYGLSSSFPAIIANHADGRNSYYLAGDFTDYRGPDRIQKFVGAPTLYRYFSIDSEGDLGYFYWNFYIPFMSQVLKEVTPLKREITQTGEVEVAEDGSQLVSKIVDGQFAVYRQGAWSKYEVKGVNIGDTLPGEAGSTLPDDHSFYLDWLEQIANMNANTIRVYRLMPPTFYRALDSYNYSHPKEQLLLLQSLTVDQSGSSMKSLDREAVASFQASVDVTVNALHGQYAQYSNDVSRYVLGYLLDPNLSAERVVATESAGAATGYAGEYVSVDKDASLTESWLATVIDYLFAYEQTNYQMQHPVAVASDSTMKPFLMHMKVSSKVTAGLFGAYSFLKDPESLKNNLESFVKEYQPYPLLISEFGYPSSGNITESEQGESIVALWQAIKDSSAMGGLIYEWADEWGKSSSKTSSRMVPYDRGSLWHNVTDPAQNYGILALESKVPTEYSMILHGSGPLDSLALTSDESYFYMKASFNQLPEFNKERIMIYLDTIDRKNGEYMLAPDVLQNWSGVEFNIRIDHRDQAQLLVIPSYNASKGTYFSAISTTGMFEQMGTGDEDESTLTAGSFEASSNHFYVENKTLYVRIPWMKLNFSDPSGLLVLNDEKRTGIFDNEKNVLTARMTVGIIASLVIMDKKTNEPTYHFPESVTSAGYKTFTWSPWEVPKYTSRQKSSYAQIQTMFLE